MTLVLDASVAVKWFLPEPYHEDAHALLAGDHRFVAPALIRLEVAAAIVRRLRIDRSEEALARQACREWDAMIDAGIVELVADEDVFADALELAISIRHSVQDCLYFAVARRTGSGLVTADGPLARRGRRVVDDVRFIGRELEN